MTATASDKGVLPIRNRRSRCHELNRYGSGHYPDLLCVEILRLVHETERQATSDPFETDLIFTARTLVENGEPKVAMFKLHEVIGGRQYSS
jgi:hypothetical protein